MMRLVVSLALSVGCAAGARPKWHELSTEYSFEQYLTDFGKAYEDVKEFGARKARFEVNLKTILAHNARPEATWRQGVNALSDWEDWEITKYKKGLDKSRVTRVKEAEQRRPALEEEEAPAQLRERLGSLRSVLNKKGLLRDAEENVKEDLPPFAWDWREKEGVVSAIKDQQSCGSCWSFAATEVIESNVALNTGKLLTLAPQEFVDCAANPDKCGGTGGCEGATAEIAFSTAMHFGAFAEVDRPYQGRDGTCANIPAPVANVTGFVMLPRNEQQPLLNAVANVGPVAVSVDATWTNYEEGVFPAAEGGTDIDHAVVVVGYGYDDDLLMDYWIVRNSWGTAWGEDGYIRLERESDPTCAIDYRNADGVGCAGDPDQVTVCGTSAILYDSSYPTGGYLL